MKLPFVLLAASSALSAASVAAAADADDASSSASEFCPTVFADFERRQLRSFANETFAYVEGGSAKHIPFLTLAEDGTKATVAVGNGDEEGGVWHPMQASEDPEAVHFVTHIMVKDQNDDVVALEALDPTVAAPATMTFDVPAGATTLTPYEWCNKHGLYKGASVAVVPSAPSAEGAACGASPYDESAWPSVHADFVRLQKLPPFASDVPFAEAEGVKHVPYITLKGDGKATVLVGDPAVAIHPMKGVADDDDEGEEPHWITEVYVVDQTGKIVAMESLDPTGVDEARMEFDVPEGAETLKAYAWCNLHGLYEGPLVGHAATGAEAPAMRLCAWVSRLPHEQAQGCCAESQP